MTNDIFAQLPDGRTAHRYTISCGSLRAVLSDLGATLLELWVPDRDGNCADVVLGYSEPEGYNQSIAFFGATVGRNANRVGGTPFRVGDSEVKLPANENANNLHSGPDYFHLRLWEVFEQEESSITFRLMSPEGDQGFPGKADIRVKYTLEYPSTLAVIYDAVSDRDTVFNLTNHSYFNLAGHDRPELGGQQTLMLPARFFTVCDAESIPTGELRSVAGTPMDFRIPKPLTRDAAEPYDALELQNGYDHNFEVFCNPCAVLTDPSSGRSMAVYTDCPGIQVYGSNFIDDDGKNGIHYPPRCAVALETQFYPDSVHHPEWPQPIVKAGAPYHSETRYSFSF